MPTPSLIRKFSDASAPLRRAATDEVIICSLKGVGPCPPIRRIIIELEDPQPRAEPVDPVNDLPSDPFVDPPHGCVK